VRFARIVFIVAGIWGFVVLTPLYWLVDVTGRRYDPPTAYPHFFYGFLSVALAWQIAFLVVGSNPTRFRVLMVPSMLEKFGYVATLAVLYGQGHIAPVDALAAAPDGLLGFLFILAFVKTRGFPVSRGEEAFGSRGALRITSHIRQGTTPQSGCGSSGSTAMYSSKWPSGSRK
jgi:hypothetical protein